MDKGGEDFVLIVGDVGVDLLGDAMNIGVEGGWRRSEKTPEKYSS